MSVYQGSPTEAERVRAESLILRKALRALEYGLRVAMPGKIVAFDSAKQVCQVQVSIRDKFYINNKWVDKEIPVLQDVPLCLPGDTGYALTFPHIVGAECLVIVADMCINAWWSTGVTPSNQEIDRRHDFSDAFAVLMPRSVPNAISNYDTDNVQLRSMGGEAALSLNTDGITVKASTVLLDGALHLSGTPTPTLPSDPTHSLPVVINGTTYYMQLKTTP